ncbi:serine hydrolase [Thermoflexibacter ruber]|nr:serine hydrolase [Thermoflexibacter ruber]
MKILIGLGILLGVIVLIAAVGMYYLSPNEEKVLDFIKNNPSKTSILLVRNDTVLAKHNADKVMPLASTVKIIIAIEYAAQAASGQINPDEKVSLEELDKFYVPNTDGEAHPSWLKSVKEKVQNNHISIREIAKGMIAYSSNANTEWLSEKLGLDRINQRIDSLELKNHTPIYYIVSSLFVGKEAFPMLKGKALEEKLKALTPEQYIGFTREIHQKLFTDTTYKREVGDMSMEIQKVWSDNLPSATVTDYISILKKINSRTYFDANTQAYLDEVMEFLLENPANKSWLEHAGMKGGSTAFVLTKALYATDKKGNKTELAYFINDLSILESIRIRLSMNEFELKVLTNENFRKKIASSLMMP